MLDDGPGTKRRLLAAASALFAAHGFHGTTMRDIAEHARVNLAAGNYHYGSKKALYLAVLRAQFAAIRSELARRGAARSEADLARLSRPALEALLHARIRVMLDLLIGPPPGLHGALMQREMCDPSEALPAIVDEFIRPMLDELVAIVVRLVPALDRPVAERCAMSVIGQALFYRTTMPAMLRMMRTTSYPRGLARQLAVHITRFSLDGMGRVHTPRRGRHAR